MNPLTFKINDEKEFTLESREKLYKITFVGFCACVAREIPDVTGPESFGVLTEFMKTWSCKKNIKCTKADPLYCIFPRSEKIFKIC